MKEFISPPSKSTIKSRFLYRSNDICELQSAMVSIISLVMFLCWKQNNIKDLRVLAIFFLALFMNNVG